MNDTFSTLMSATYNSLGQPPDNILSRLELATILFRRLSFRLEAVRNSEQAEQIAKSSEFTLANGENTKDLTTLETDFVIPLWAEYKSWAYLGNPVWVFLPTVHISMLPQQRNLGRYACSFYGSNAREVIMETSLYGNEIFTPSATLRVWYSPDIPFPSDEGATIDLPNNLVNMVQYDALVSALPIMIANAAKLVSDQPIYAAQITAWEGLYKHYLMEREEFQHYFDKWRTESRGSHRPRKRQDVLTSMIGRGTNFPWFIHNGGS